jgi:hypothetical protein
MGNVGNAAASILIGNAPPDTGVPPGTEYPPNKGLSPWEVGGPAESVGDDGGTLQAERVALREVNGRSEGGCRVRRRVGCAACRANSCWSSNFAAARSSARSEAVAVRVARVCCLSLSPAARVCCRLDTRHFSKAS